MQAQLLSCLQHLHTVCEDLNDICENLSLQGARLDAIMAIDPETFEPTPVTDDSKITDEKPNIEKGGDE